MFLVSTVRFFVPQHSAHGRKVGAQSGDGETEEIASVLSQCPDKLADCEKRSLIGERYANWRGTNPAAFTFR